MVSRGLTFLFRIPTPKAALRDPVPFVGPPECGVSGLLHGVWLAAPSKFCNEIGGLLPIAPCGRTSL